jgi:hypothetical protein
MLSKSKVEDERSKWCVMVWSSLSLFSAIKWNTPHLSREVHSNCAVLHRSFNQAGYRTRAMEDTSSGGAMVILMIIEGMSLLQ